MTAFALDKRRAKLMGVCSGLAGSIGVDARLVRIAVVLLTAALFGTWGVIAYLAAGFMAPVRDS